MRFVAEYFDEIKEVVNKLSLYEIDAMIEAIVELRERSGRLFILGVGGSAANASHAVNDFRKLCEIEAYCVSDNVSELTARVNDDGWDTSYSNWLTASNISGEDALLIFSVGGGNAERGVSINIVNAINLAKSSGAKVFGIVGRDGGYTKIKGDVVSVIPVVSAERVTPHSEAFQAVIWHCIVSDPRLAAHPTKW